jgi:phenylalanyl-tRNA synthetase beta chain
MSLVSKKDNYHNLRLEVDETECVVVGNPKTVDFEAVRTSLLPGLLKTLKENTDQIIPQKIFEISDCVILDGETDTGARNVRKISALSLDHASNFEVIHGLLDMMMLKCGVDMEKGKNYRLVADEENRRFFPQNGASVMLNNKKIGMVGVLHPEVLGNFDLKYPVSCFEIEFDAVFD